MGREVSPSSWSIQTTSLGTAATLDDAVAVCLTWLHDIPAHPSPPRRWLRAEVSLPPNAASPLLWLRAQAANPSSSHERVYFRTRDRSGLESAGVGFAIRLTAHGPGPTVDEHARSVMCGMLSTSPHVRFYGATRFDTDLDPDSHTPSSTCSAWRPFGRYTFVLPVLELQRAGPNGHCRLALNVPRELNSALSLAMPILTTLAPYQKPLARRLPSANRSHLLDPYGAYAGAMAEILSDLTASNYEKIVLVRRRAFDFDVRPLPVDVVDALDERIGGGYLFCLELSPDTAFVGCSPERLFRIEGNAFATEAMAGTIRRGRDASRPAANGIRSENHDGGRRDTSCHPSHDVTDGEDDVADVERRLLSSAKDLVEHKYVADYITAVLRKCGASVQANGPQVVRLPHLCHLQTEISGEFARNGFHSPVDRALELLRHMHPTPAVCGMPRNVTMRRIPDLERFDRGLYAGPFGYFGLEASEFCVAIRSALVTRRQVVAYAGGGIVAASKTKSEWDEGELKMSTIRSILESKDDSSVRSSPRSLDEFPDR